MPSQTEPLLRLFTSTEKLLEASIEPKPEPARPQGRFSVFLSVLFVLLVSFPVFCLAFYLVFLTFPLMLLLLGPVAVFFWVRWLLFRGVPTPTPASHPKLLSLSFNLESAACSLRTKDEEHRFSYREVESTQMEIGPEEGKPIELTIHLQRTSPRRDGLSFSFFIQELDRRDEAMDFCFRIGRAMGYQAYAVRYDALDRRELEFFTKPAPKAPPEDPFRTPAFALYTAEATRPLPLPNEPPDYQAAFTRAHFQEPTEPIAPFVATDAKAPGEYQIVWHPGEKIEITHPATPTSRWKKSLAAFCALLLSIAIHLLGYPISQCALSTIEDAGEKGSLAFGVTLFSLIISVLVTVPVAYTEADPGFRSFHHGLFQLSTRKAILQKELERKEVDFASLYGVILRQREGRHQIELLLPGPDWLLVEFGERDTALSFMTSLAKVLDLPWGESG